MGYQSGLGGVVLAKFAFKGCSDTRYKTFCHELSRWMVFFLCSAYDDECILSIERAERLRECPTLFLMYCDALTCHCTKTTQKTPHSALKAPLLWRWIETMYIQPLTLIYLRYFCSITWSQFDSFNQIRKVLTNMKKSSSCVVGRVMVFGHHSSDVVLPSVLVRFIVVGILCV